jgi:sugar phosphate isomerase/epimerase
MKPRIAISNIFDQDADSLLEFVSRKGFEGVDWSIDKEQSERAFIAQMVPLSTVEVRFHCALPGIDFAYADSRAESSMEVLTQTIERIARVGRKHITVHTGFGHVSAHELDFTKALKNLTLLVERGAQCGVCISLENLTSHWTSEPELFNALIEQSGAGATLDIGHAHVCSSHNPGSNVYQRYIIPHQDRIVNAHIYHTEQSGVGHVAPNRIEDIYDRLELLRGAESCTWWVIELKKRRDILYTRDLLNHYINTSFSASPSEKEVVKTPQQI